VDVLDGKHQPAPEAIVSVTVAPGHEEACLLGVLQGNPFPLQVVPQGSPALRRVTETERVDDGGPESPSFEVGPSPRARSRLQHFGVEGGGHPVHPDQAFP